VWGEKLVWGRWLAQRVVWNFDLEDGCVCVCVRSVFVCV